MRFKKRLLEFIEPNEAQADVGTQVNTEKLPFSPEVNTLIAADKWAEAYDKLVNASDVDAFLDLFLQKYKPFESFQDRIEAIKPVLKRVFMSLGSKAFKPETNPLLAFLPSYFSLSSSNKFTQDQFRSLTSLWSQGIIDDKMLRKHEPKDHIIFNHNLYDMQNMTFIVQAYNWLSKESNVQPYINLKDRNVRNFDSDIEYVIGKQGRDKLGRFTAKEINYKLFRDMIIFENADSAGRINDASEIQARLKRLQMKDSRYNKDEDEQEKPKEKVVVRPEKYSKDEINTIFTSGLNNLKKSSVNKILNYFKDQGWM